MREKLIRKKLGVIMAMNIKDKGYRLIILLLVLIAIWSLTFMKGYPEKKINVIKVSSYSPCCAVLVCRENVEVPDELKDTGTEDEYVKRLFNNYIPKKGYKVLFDYIKSEESEYIEFDTSFLKNNDFKVLVFFDKNDDNPVLYETYLVSKYASLPVYSVLVEGDTFWISWIDEQKNRSKINYVNGMYRRIYQEYPSIFIILGTAFSKELLKTVVWFTLHIVLVVHWFKGRKEPWIFTAIVSLVGCCKLESLAVAKGWIIYILSVLLYVLILSIATSIRRYMSE